MTAPLVTVIIVNWNGKHFLETCLSSLEKQSLQDFEITLVDNGSVDNSVNYVQQNFPHVKLIPLSHNTGFSVGNNIAIRQAKSKYIATLNNDTEVTPSWLEALVTVAETQQVEMVSSKMIYQSHNRKIIDSMGLQVHKNGLGISIGNGQIDEGQYDDLEDIFAPCAGAALYKTSLFKEIGQFDDDYFAYYEDLDFGWRSRLAGKKCKSAPNAVVFHHHSGSSSGQKIYFLHRNKIFTILKNLPEKQLIKYLPQMISTDTIASAYSVFSEHTFLTYKAKVDALKMLPIMLRKRKNIQINRRVDDQEIESWFAKSESLAKILNRRRKKAGEKLL